MFDEFFTKAKKVTEGTEILYEPIEEGDENKYLMVGENAVLPASARLSLADQKSARQMAMNATIGSMGSKKSAAESAFQKLRQAVLDGYKPSAAEMLAVSKYRNKPIVVPSAEDVKRVIDSSDVSLRRFENIKKVIK